MKNFYYKYRFKLFKFSNFENPSPNFADPSNPILFNLLNFKIQYKFLILNVRKFIPYIKS